MKNRKVLNYLLLLAAIPLLIILFSVLFREKQYAFISLVVVVLSLIPFIIKFEADEKTNTVRLVMIAVMTAISVVGRFAFSYTPHFKPVAAIVIVTGIYLGAESGFLCGVLSAVVSNFIFGQGAWTPFQMFAWGVIGFFAGALSKLFINHKFVLYIYAAFSGLWYSLILDTWTAVYIDGTFNFSRYITLISAALPITIIYAVSNVLFLMILFKPIGKRIERMTVKYGLNKQL